MTRAAPGQITVARWKHARSEGTTYRARQSLLLPDGTRKRIYAYGRTRAEAVEGCERKAQLERAAHAGANTITLEQLLAEWVTSRERIGRKPKSISDYIRLIRTHIIPALGDRPITRVDLEDVQDLVYQLAGEGKYRTGELIAFIIGSSYRYAITKYRREIRSGELILLNPTDGLEMPVKPPPDPSQNDVWTEAEVEAFLAVAEAEYDQGQNLFYPLLLTALYSGLRRGELLGLRWDKVQSRQSTNGDTIHYLRIDTQIVFDGTTVLEGPPKTRSGIRDRVIDQGLFELLMLHKERLAELKRRTRDWEENNLVFPNMRGGVTHPSNLYRAMKRYFEISGTPRRRLHTTRKWFSTYLSRRLHRLGFDPIKGVQHALGHARDDVARNTYIRMIEEELEHANLPVRGTGWGTSAKERDGKSLDSPS